EPAAASPVAPKSKTAKKDPRPPVRGQYAGVDANTADRFRKGKYAIDATLDLHGMTREKAHRSLLTFIESHWNRGSRCLLVITGKGLRTTGEDGQPRGVLREALPEWLAGENMGRMVLAF